MRKYQVHPTSEAALDAATLETRTEKIGEEKRKRNSNHNIGKDLYYTNIFVFLLNLNEKFGYTSVVVVYTIYVKKKSRQKGSTSDVIFFRLQALRILL